MIGKMKKEIGGIENKMVRFSSEPPIRNNYLMKDIKELLDEDLDSERLKVELFLGGLFSWNKGYKERNENSESHLDFDRVHGAYGDYLSRIVSEQIEREFGKAGGSE
jgi:hypothetical protein